MRYDAALDCWVLELGGEEQERTVVVAAASAKAAQIPVVSDGGVKETFMIRRCWKSIKKSSFRPCKMIVMCCASNIVDVGAKFCGTAAGSTTSATNYTTAGSAHEEYSSTNSRSVHDSFKIVPREGYYSAMSSEERDWMLKEAIEYCTSRWAAAS